LMEIRYSGILRHGLFLEVSITAEYTGTGVSYAFPAWSSLEGNRSA
jgi:hypothetical protein